MPVFRLPRDPHGGTIGALRPTAAHTLAFGTAATETAPVNSPVARVGMDVAGFYSFGTQPTSATSEHWLPAGLVEWIAIIPGDRFTARSATGGTGTFHVSEAV